MRVDELYFHLVTVFTFFINALMMLFSFNIFLCSLAPIILSFYRFISNILKGKAENVMLTIVGNLGMIKVHSYRGEGNINI